ncbi:hypothetical protein Skr01_16150 [Sphaerisporangium krabiense]|uniref:Uncharacterized protein n=1 Tax=Sphaerisporangium krabiense TaxID=763782 RepID=A0A7W8YZ69_9ACTN|nr:hypothetical protein [Sphaerisporangium krabiense]MBB5624514.1 hypothetical protein [Sphaerisporangium krabiense]GII61530.1 hypothetical protein Skr01_16150 [Sphaerisporangium krabiense]
MSRAILKPARRSKPMIRRLISAAIGILTVAVLTAPPATALALPTPKDFVSNLDLECFKTSPYQPPATTLTLRHLNPVLGNLPTEQVTLGPREQLCVPVAKNNVLPPTPVLEFIRYVDLACYRIQGASVNTQLVLSHLNPVLQTLPRQQVTMNAPQHLCVPVAKNNVTPPAEVLSLVSHIDLKCYDITPNTPLNLQLGLRQLNPVLVDRIPAHSAQVAAARQLCVPVFKAGDTVPSAVVNILRWIDLEKYDILTQATPTISLTLRHLNPVLGKLPVEQATIGSAVQLAVPVAKNGQFPPS